MLAHRTRGVLLFRELKRQREQPTNPQVVWLGLLSAAGVDTGVWRLADLLEGRIERELGGCGVVVGRVG